MFSRCCFRKDPQYFPYLLQVIINLYFSQFLAWFYLLAWHSPKRKPSLWGNITWLLFSVYLSSGVHWLQSREVLLSSGYPWSSSESGAQPWTPAATSRVLISRNFPAVPGEGCVPCQGPQSESRELQSDALGQTPSQPCVLGPTPAPKSLTLLLV